MNNQLKAKLLREISQSICVVLMIPEKASRGDEAFRFQVQAAISAKKPIVILAVDGGPALCNLNVPDALFVYEDYLGLVRYDGTPEKLGATIRDVMERFTRGERRF